MLDTDTKRRIDTARDILVGKVPDPKSQVEQITIALIYKFMDDMDAEAEELGGKRKFFAGDFVRYGWAKLMRSGLGGHETLNLYAEAIAKMPENPGIPPLFRDIFKNAYLPYRDPETLRAFLKIIDEFNYDHSERLGDAFEYLLSCLSSQGDAGMFRTPRHIIDFIVEIVDPKKTDVILDPACGTAGFLISSYKHIRKTNTGKDGHSTLTPDERGRLAANFRGYDISPDMVRLSLVNLYLHGFTDPHIYEYDTLTSKDRWNEYADVILANPPFMSPKGGIKPHNRFSVQSKRSEVLFVDYMAEHLSPNGRAGIIVPEGIIFQSGTAYRQLRKMMVEECLVAVVSLPAGEFNPYSGVKTSILILDKTLAKQTDRIAFFKITNDGFGLGAQRREIDKNDLPQAHTEITEYLRRLRARESTDDFQPILGLVVSKERIAENGDYNLSGERYRKVGTRHSTFSLRPFEEVCTLEYGASLPKEKRNSGPYPVVGSNGITGYHKEFLVAGPAIVVGRKGSAGEVTWVQENCFPIDTTYYVKQSNPSKSDLRYLYWLLKTLNLTQLRGGAGIPGLNRTDVYTTHRIPLPPLEIQKEIVAEIEGYQKVINGARAVLDNYRPHIPIDPEWPMVRLADACETITDGDHQPPPKANEGVPFVTITNIGNDHELDFTKTFFVPESYYANLSPARKPRKGDILYSVTGSYGIPVMVRSDRCFCFQRHIAIIRPAAALNNAYLHSLLSSPLLLNQGHEAATGVAQKTVSLNSLRNFQIPLPPIATQQAIVAEIEAEQTLVAANRELITRFEKKIQATLARVWGESPGTAEPVKSP
jgi:type I restriction enzyme M protein